MIPVHVKAAKSINSAVVEESKGRVSNFEQDS